MLDRSLRPLKTAALAPIATRLAPMPAGAVTGVGLGVGLGAAGLAAAGWWVPALFAWLISRVLDGLDGELARAGGTASDRGGYIDLVADAVVYAAVPIGVAVGIGTDGAWIAAAVLLAACYVNIVTVTMLAAVLEKRSAGAAARGETTTVTLPDGLIEGSETIFLLALVLAAPAVAVWTMAAMAAAVAATAVTRVLAAWPALGPEPTGSPRRSNSEIGS